MVIKALLQDDMRLPSCNSMYKRSKSGGLYLAKEAKDFRNYLLYSMKVISEKPYDSVKYTTLYLFMTIALRNNDLFTKKGKFRKRDLSNTIKFLEDTLFIYLNKYYDCDDLDDSMVFGLKAEYDIVSEQSKRYILFNVV
jgi:hypothetical protein